MSAKMVDCEICGESMPLQDARVWWVAMYPPPGSQRTVGRVWVAHRQYCDGDRITGGEQKRVERKMKGYLCDENAMRFCRMLPAMVETYGFSGAQVADLAMRFRADIDMECEG